MILEAIIIGLTIGAFIILVTTGYIIGIYNNLKTLVQDIKTQWSNILTEYQRRADLFYNLVATVKGYAKHEKETLKLVTEARAGAFGKTKTQQIKKAQMLETALSRLAIVIEKYPELRAHTNFSELQEEIRITEDRINIARTDYNNIVRDYNVMRTTFPSNVVSNTFKFKEEQYFEAEEEAKKAPKISFEQ